VKSEKFAHKLDEWNDGKMEYWVFLDARVKDEIIVYFLNL
jgi:protein-disulfide isomerase